MNNQEEKKETFILTERALTRVIVLLIVGSFLIFIAGYYVGKKRMCEELMLRDELVFAGKVQSALTNLAGRASEEDDEASEDLSEVEAEAGENRSEAEVIEEDSSTAGASVNKSESRAYARLCGFATEAAARDYASRLGKRGVSVRVVERLSQTRRGKQVKWFQVVTEPMERSQLDTLLENIAKNDKLTDVTIVDLAE